MSLRSAIAGTPIDLAYLDAQTLGDADLKRDLLDLFIHQAQRLGPAILGPPGDARRDAAHTLAGAALAIGAHELGEMLRGVEQRAAVWQPDSPETREDLIAALDRASRFAEQHLAAP